MLGDVQLKKEIADLRQIIEDAGFTKRGERPRVKNEEKITDLNVRVNELTDAISDFGKRLRFLEEVFDVREAKLRE